MGVQFFPALWMEITPIGRKSIQGPERLVEKPTALEGFPTSDLFFIFKLGEIKNETNLKQKKKPLSSRTGLRRVLRGLK